ncbi:glycoside hydrolase family 15 protein [Nanoarchaeota archaeon]
MPREIVLGNQCLLVNIDKWLQVRDFFYPHVGEENHVQGHAHKLGVFTDGHMSWVNDQPWERNIDYDKNTLVSHATAVNNNMQVSLQMHDCVACDMNIYLKKVSVKNLADRQRSIKVFFYQDFNLYGNDVGDTAGYDAHRNSIFHYKRRRYVMINAIKEETCTSCQPNGDLTDFAVGHSKFGDNLGTWKDADDGILSKNPIAQGTVDSTVCIELDMQPGEEQVFYYWISAGKTRDEIIDLNDYMMQQHPDKIFERTRKCWEGIVNSKQKDFKDLSPEAQELYKRSVLITISQIDKDGAITAANDSDNMKFNRDTYSYCWPRDGALVALGMDKAGFHEYTKPFFKFCSRIISKHGSLLHKYNPDGSLGSTWHPWVKNGKPHLPIQEDETALVIYAFWHHIQKTKDKLLAQHLYPVMVVPACEFMSKHVMDNGLPIESYDLWEEREGIMTFTVSTIIGGLRAGANFAEMFNEHDRAAKYREAAERMKAAMLEHLWNKDTGMFYRMVNFNDKVTKDDTCESANYGVFEFGVLPADDEKVVSSMEKMKERLWVKTDIGGMARSDNDYYHRVSQEVPGNPWFITTMWLGKWHVAKAKNLDDLAQAKEMIDWVVKNATSSGMLAEQLNPYTGEPVSVSPLTWSHATYLDLVNDYIEKYGELSK